MANIEFLEKASVNQRFNYLYTGLAYDGKYLYFTCPDMKLIYVYNKKFKNTGVIKINNKYSYICYDNKDECFWCCTDKKYNTIYKLNKDFSLIDKITFDALRMCNGNIKGLSFDCFTNSILVAYSNCVMLVSKDEKINNISILESYKSIITSVVSIAPTLIVTYSDGSKKTLVVYDNNLKVIDSFEFEKNTSVFCGVFDPCEDFFNNKYKFYFLCSTQENKQIIVKWIYNCSHNCMFVDFKNYYVVNNYSPLNKHLIKIDGNNSIEEFIYVENSLNEIIDYQNKIKVEMNDCNDKFQDKSKFVDISISKLNELKSNLKGINN